MADGLSIWPDVWAAWPLWLAFLVICICLKYIVDDYFEC